MLGIYIASVYINAWIRYLENILEGKNSLRVYIIARELIRSL